MRVTVEVSWAWGFWGIICPPRGPGSLDIYLSTPSRYWLRAAPRGIASWCFLLLHTGWESQVPAERLCLCLRKQ